MFGFGSSGPLCACPAKLKLAGIPAALPVPELPSLPPVLDGLLPVLPGVAAQRALAPKLQARLSAAMAVKLPALPVPSASLGALESLGPAVALVRKALGIDLASPAASAQLAASLRGLPGLPLPPLPPIPPAALALNRVAMVVQCAQAQLGINLLKPALVPKLQATLNATVPPPPLPFDPAPFAALSSVLRLASAFKINLTTPSAVLKLAASVRAVAVLSVPALPPPGPTLHLSALLSLLNNLMQSLKLNLRLPVPRAQITAALPSLPELGALQLSESVGSAALAWVPLSALAPALSANLPALAKLDLSPLANLPPVPDLGPLAAAASLVTSLGLASRPGACGSCAMG
jgi:hypothetical protein